jgi:Ca2+-transporting ATPase
MGDGTSVAKEASDITIVDNSFASITRAVMWGRSLYRNIQRFILFQMTVTMAACFIVLISALLGMETPLTVTQMLWVNLIMDTFAAMALASLPPSMTVMKDAPRKREDFIIDKAMWANILSVGLIFTVLILGLAYVTNTYDIKSLADLLNLSALAPQSGVSPYERSLMFTLFVMFQFWNMFNARAYLTGASALHFKGCNSFVSIAAVIVLGQVAIVTLGGTMFNVQPLSLEDWFICILGTSIVLWIGELFRLFKK